MHLSSSAIICQETGERDGSISWVARRVHESERFRLGDLDVLKETYFAAGAECKLIRSSASVRTCSVCAII